MKNKVILLVPVWFATALGAYAETPVPAPASAAAPVKAPSTTKTTAARTSSAENAISIRNFAFAPTAVTIAVGTTVKWKNLDGEPHTVRGIDSSLRSDALDQNDSFAFRFDKPGTYHYMCSIHPQMTGTIVVKASQ